MDGETTFQQLTPGEPGSRDLGATSRKGRGKPGIGSGSGEPSGEPGSEEDAVPEDSDQAVEGRDRLKENEEQSMDPGVSDSQSS